MPSPSFSTKMSSANGTWATPGGVHDIIISAHNTLNGTYHSDTTQVIHHDGESGSGAAAALNIALQNNFEPDYYHYKYMNAYITGTDNQGRIVFVGANGDLIYPSSGGSTTPVPITQNIGIRLSAYPGTINVKVPIAIKAGRIYFAAGDLKFFMLKGGDGKDTLVQPDEVNLKDPSAGTMWSFAEFTYGEDNNLYANVSYVDFVGIPVSMQLSTNDGQPSDKIFRATG